MWTNEGICAILLAHPPSRFGGWARSRLWAASAFLETGLPTANVYIDGFNLHYGALRQTPHRWLDLEKLCALLLPHNDIAVERLAAGIAKRSAFHGRLPFALAVAWALAHGLGAFGLQRAP